uniref:Globin family profile domain-containing protein n=1 Tax=Acrobeloides nanus TaxID=290746 RepID=A0A914EMQ8_9BILA
MLCCGINRLFNSSAPSNATVTNMISEPNSLKKNVETTKSVLNSNSRATEPGSTTDPTLPNQIDDSMASMQRTDNLINYDIRAAEWDPTDEEKELIRTSWSEDEKFQLELGKKIYEYIFKQTPAVQSHFTFYQINGDNWAESSEFRHQALKFVQTISDAVKNIYYLKQFEQRLFDLGEKHSKYFVRGSMHMYWDTFMVAIEYALAWQVERTTGISNEQRADAMECWRHLTHYMIEHMKRGYLEGVAKSTTSLSL